MPQNYTSKGSTTGTPDQLRQALGYVPARVAKGGTGSGIIVTGGPSGPEISFDTSVLLAAGAFFVGEEAEDSSALVIPGPAGQAGASGSVGPPGGDGEDGSDGWSIPGPIGATGSTGATGPTGSIGPPGSDGEDGAEGLSIPGPVGPQGAAGAAGAIGPMGPFLQGDEGPEGPSGFSIVGPPGAAGAAGVAGAAGSPGPPGVDGEGVDHFELVGFPQVKDADLVLTDITVNDVSTSRHGFTPKAPNDATKFLDGTGAWSIPAGSGTLLYSDGSVPAGNTVANTVTETAFTSAYTLPATSVSVGDVLRITMTGLYSTALVAPNLTGKIKLGGTTVLNTGALTAVAGVTNAGWTMTAWLIVTAIGSGGTVEAQAYAEFATAATTALSANVTNTAAVSINFATTEAITSTVQWSAASASNSITLRQMAIEKLTTANTNNASGTVFPPSPLLGQQFFRTDRGIDYYWDGTRWLSKNVYTLQLNVGDTGATPLTANAPGARRVINPWVGLYSIYCTEVALTNYITVAGTWTLSLVSYISGASTVTSTFTTTGDTASVFTGKRNTVNAVLGSTVSIFQLDITKTSGGNIYPFMTILYRLIG